LNINGNKRERQFVLLRYLARFLAVYKTISQLKNYNSMNDNSKVVIALLAGLAAGAALGMLFAPDKGSETRDMLSESLKNLGDSIKETAANEINNLVGLKDKVVENIKTKINGAEAEYQDDLEHA
jgi:gas vesicle protein